MNATDYTGPKIVKQQENAPDNGGQKLVLNKRHCSSNESKTGKPDNEQPKVFWITRMEACAVLECHTQTLRYREMRGEITGRKVGRHKLYNLADVEKILAENPVASRPYKPRKRRKKAIVIPPKPPSLWERFKALFL